MANQIRFNIGFQVDKAGLTELQNQLVQIQVAANRSTQLGNLTPELRAAGQAASQLEEILNRSWNSKLGQLDLSRVNNEIKKTYGSVSNLRAQLEGGGAAGAAAYNRMASSVLSTNLQLKQSNKLLDEMATSMANTVKWGVTSGIFNKITQSIQQAFNYTKKLDSSLNDIRIVTDKSAESMEKFAVQANKAAKNLGTSTMDYTQASLIYYQQGLDDTEVAARAETTLKAANVTGQTGAEVSEQLTAVWNGYKVSAEETELYIDKLAAVAATTAADLEELSTGMSKVASAANIMGVDIDQLNAQLATIVSVTREAPESIGTALKTVYARMSDITAGLDGETSLNEYTEQMAAMGINALDANGHLRDMGEVVEEIGGKWSSLTREQQTSLAQTIAGTRQYSRMMSLFDNWDMYTKALETSANAAGTLQEQQDILMESTKAHLQQLKTEAEETYDILFDQDTVNGFADTLTGTLGIFNNFLKGTGGGLNSLVTLGLGIANIFNKQIGNAINNQILNLESFRKNAEGINLKEQFIQDIKARHQAQGQNVSSDAALLREAEYAEQILNIRSQLTTEEYNELTALQQQIGLDEQRIQGIEQYREIARGIMDLEDEQIENFDELDSSYQERIEIENESLQILRERRGAFNEELQIYQDLNESDENRAQSAENLRDILEQLPQNQADQIEATRIISDLEAGRALNETDILNVQRLQRNQVDEQRELVNRLRMGAQGVRDAESGVYAQLVQQRNAREALLQQQIREREQSELMSGMTRGITTAFMGLSTMGGIIKTINDESMGIEEKINSISTTMLMFLPFFITNFDSLGKIIPGLTLSMTRLAAANGSVAASQAIAQGTTLGLVGAFKALITSTVTFMGVSAPLWAVIAGAVAIVGALGLTIWGITKAWNADAEAAEKAAEAVKAATKAYNECREAVEKLKDTMSDYKESIKQLEKLDEAAENYAETLEDVNEKAMALIETYKLYDDYTIENGAIKINEEKLDEISDKEEANLNKVKLYEIGTKTYNDKIKADKDVDEQITNISKSNAYLFTSEEIKSITAAMSSLENTVFLNDEALKEALLTNENLSDNIKELVYYIVQYKYQYKNLADSIKKAEEASLHYAKEILSIGVEERYKEKYQELTKGDAADYSQLMAATTAGILKLNEENENNIQVEIDNKNEEIKEEVKDTKGLNKVLEQYETGYTIKNKEDLMLRYAEVLTGKSRDTMTYNKKKVVDETGQEIVNKEVSEQVMSQEIAKYEAMNAIKKKYASKEQEGEKEFNSALEKVYTSSAEIFGIDFSGIILNSIANGAKNFDLSSIFSQLSPEEILAMEKMSPEQLASALNLTPQQIKDLGYSSAEAFETAFDESLSKYDISAFLDKIKSNINLIGTAMEEFDDGLSEETIKELEAEYTELGKIWDKNSKEYLEALEEIRELEEENLKKGLEYSQADYFEKSKQSLQEFQKMVEDSETGIEVDESEFTKVTEELENNLKEFFEQSYELDISITNDVITDVENIVNQAENAAKAVELIGDGFRVAAKDSEELLTMFPELAENAEVLADGTIQLSNTVTSTILKNQGIEIDADKEKVAQSIDNRITELEAKKASAEAQLEAIQNTAANELELEEILGESYTDFSNYKSELSGTIAKDEVFNSGKSAEAVIDNWAAKEQAAMDYATTAIEAEAPGHKTNGPRIDSSKSNIKTEISTQNTTDTVDNNVITEAQQRQKELAEEYVQNQIDSYETQIADLTIAKSKLFGSVKNIEDSANDKGKGDTDKRDEEYKDKDEEIDRYWELNKAIEEVTEALSDLDKKQEKLHGKELIASLKEENKLLKKQAKAYQELAAEQRKEAGELQGKLMSQGVKFDKEGGVANYQQAAQAALDKYNQAVTAYNSFTIDEATFKAEQQAYENFKATLERYEELYYNEMRDTQNELDEIHRKELENNLEAWEVKIQVKLDMSEMERQWDDFFEQIQEDFKSVAPDLNLKMKTLTEKSKTYQGEDGDIATTIQAIKDVQAEIDKMQSGEESDMFESVSQAQEKLKELNDDLQKSALDMKDLWKESWDTYLGGIDQSADQFDDLMERYDNINKQIEYQKELIELLYGDEAYDLMTSYYDAQKENTNAEIKSLKQQADVWKKRYEQALAIDEANGTTSKDTQKFYELWQGAQEKLNGKVIDYIDLLQNDYKNTISGVITELEKSLTGGSTLDEAKEQWELLQEQADKYYDDVERIYEISNLAGKYETSIANTSELKNQQKLQELYDREMEYLENKKYLTEYDLEVANARYDMALKQIALEEAQQNKNAMKLTRGADGNWSYQYVADEDDIASKQQALLDAANGYYQITKDGYYENLEDMMNAQATYLEKLQEINEKYMNDEEMRAQKAQELYEMYYGEGGILPLLYTENEERRTNMADATFQSLTTFYAIDEENYERMTETERALIDGLKDGTLDNYNEILEKAKEVCGETLGAWESSAQKIVDQWNKDKGESVRAQVEKAYEEMKKANNKYKTAVDELEKTVEQDFGKEGITGALGDAQEKTEQLDEKTKELCDNTKSNLDTYRDAVDQIGEAWEAVKDQVQDAIDLVEEYLNLVGSGGSNSGGNSDDPGSGGGSNPGGGGNSGGSPDSGEKPNSNKNNDGLTKSVSVTMYPSVESVGEMYTRTVTKSNKKELKELKEYENYTNNWYLKLTTGEEGYISKSAAASIQKLKTGGYTGNWQGENGKLAFLHSKELVLNAKDTENILSAVNTVRSIANLGDSINQSIMNGISQMVLGLTGLGKYGNYSVGETKESGNTIFEIQANFPNAGDVESIREAIMSLPNLASQYIARNKK